MSIQSIPVQQTVEYAIVPEWPAYRVGSDGSVWTCWRKGPGSVAATTLIIERGQQRWKQMRPRVDYEGYRSVELVGLDGRTLHRKVCQIVLRAFVGPPPEGHESRHLDGNELNDSRENLAWGTPLENHADKRRHGTIAKGLRHGLAKLSDGQIDEIMALKGSAIQRVVADRFGVSRGYVGQLWAGSRKRA
jgi:hypothetical protein